MTEFVTIRPTLLPDREDGKRRRIPMPAGYGLPGFGMPLPAGGYRVPHDHFVRRLIADKDAEIVPPKPEAAPKPDAPADTPPEPAAQPEQPAHSEDAA